MILAHVFFNLDGEADENLPKTIRGKDILGPATESIQAENRKKIAKEGEHIRET